MRIDRLLVLAVVLTSSLGCGPTETPSQDAPATHGTGYLPEGAISPSLETIRSGTYTPLSRPLMVYVNKAALKRPEAVAFLQFIYSPDGQELVGESGYVKLDEATYLQQREKVAEAVLAAGGGGFNGDLAGEVMIDGSSTVAPILTAIAEEFSQANRRVRVPLGTSGTGGGMKKFTAGEIDICNASRFIKDSEIELCKSANIEFLELLVGLDGLTIVVHPSNTWVDGLTIQQLQDIWKPDSKISKWSDLNPAFPDAAIKLFGPDTDSGTFEYFTEAVCHKGGASRSDYQQSADDNVLVKGVANDQYALAYFGFAYYAENKDKIKVLGIAP